MKGTDTYQQEKLMSAPLTMEDKGQFINLPLINTLRGRGDQATGGGGGSDAAGGKSGEGEEGQEENDAGGKPAETVPVPPSFYDADIDRWYGKFKKDVEARQTQKKQLARVSDITCLTRNTNIRTEDDGGHGKKRGKTQLATGGDDKGKNSLFNQVLKRRKSRGSIYAPVNLDF